MPDWIATVIAVITLLFGGGGIAAIVQLVQNRRRPALDQRAVEVATAGDSVGMSLELATTAMEQVRAFQERVAVLEGEVQSNKARAESAEARAESAERKADRAQATADAVTTWAHHVVANWATVRLQQTPPDLPAVIRGGPL